MSPVYINNHKCHHSLFFLPFDPLLHGVCFGPSPSPLHQIIRTGHVPFHPVAVISLPLCSDLSLHNCSLHHWPPLVYCPFWMFIYFAPLDKELPLLSARTEQDWVVYRTGNAHETHGQFTREPWRAMCQCSFVMSPFCSRWDLRWEKSRFCHPTALCETHCSESCLFQTRLLWGQQLCLEAQLTELWGGGVN